MTEVKLDRVRSNSGWVTSEACPHNQPSRPFGRDVKIGVPCLDVECTVGLSYISVARSPDKPTQNTN